MSDGKKKWLMDVVLIRLVLIFLLVFYHSLCIHTKGWVPPYKGFTPIPAYDWIGNFFHYFRLEGMVFISGLLFGYKLHRCPDTLTFKDCIIRKIKRILLPCFIFGSVFYVLFYDINASAYRITTKILFGCGHLWFLPMIFWCFVFTYILELLLHKWQDKHHWISVVILCLTVFLSLFRIISRLKWGYAGLGNFEQFYMFFFLGFMTKRYGFNFGKFKSYRMVIAIVLIFAFYVIEMSVKKHFFNYPLSRIGAMYLSRVIDIVISLSAIYVFTMLSNRKKVIDYLTARPYLIKLSTYCYGVYIYQEFILRLFIYKTSITHVVPDVLLPWLLTAVTICLALLLCHLTLKTRVGRYLIG